MRELPVEVKGGEGKGSGLKGSGEWAWILHGIEVAKRGTSVEVKEKGGKGERRMKGVASSTIKIGCWRACGDESSRDLATGGKAPLFGVWGGGVFSGAERVGSLRSGVDGKSLSREWVSRIERLNIQLSCGLG